MLVGYARVSTLDQNPFLQILAPNEAVSGKIYVEKASGARQVRPQLKAAFEYIRDGDTLVVWKLSRLARSLKQVIKTVQGIQDGNIEFKVLTQSIDTSTPEGRLFFHITAAFDQFQLELIIENSKAGLAAARKGGRQRSRPSEMDDEKVRFAKAMLQGTESYPFVNDAIKPLEIGRTAFNRYFSPKKIRELRPPRAKMSVSRE